MFESKSKPLLPMRQFLRRIAGYGLVATGVLLTGLGIGVLGYHFVAGLSWLDAFLNASMILTGMGPVDPMRNVAGKVFAALYALFSGVVFLSAMAVVLAPLFHRMLHKFHLDEEDMRKKR